MVSGVDWSLLDWPVPRSIRLGQRRVRGPQVRQPVLVVHDAHLLLGRLQRGLGLAVAALYGDLRGVEVFTRRARGLHGAGVVGVEDLRDAPQHVAGLRAASRHADAGEPDHQHGSGGRDWHQVPPLDPPRGRVPPRSRSRGLHVDGAFADRRGVDVTPPGHQQRLQAGTFAGRGDRHSGLVPPSASSSSSSSCRAARSIGSSTSSWSTSSPESPALSWPSDRCRKASTAAPSSRRRSGWSRPRPNRGSAGCRSVPFPRPRARRRTRSRSSARIERSSCWLDSTGSRPADSPSGPLRSPLRPPPPRTASSRSRASARCCATRTAPGCRTDRFGGFLRRQPDDHPEHQDLPLFGREDANNCDILPDSSPCMARCSGPASASGVSGTSATGSERLRADARCASATLCAAMPYTNARNGRP